MELLSLILFIILVSLLSTIEYLEYKTILTPLTVMAFPYLIIVVFVNLFGWHRSYFPVTSESIGFVAINIMIFWLTGQSVWLVSRGRMWEQPPSQFLDFVKEHKLLLRIIIGFGVLSGMIKFTHTLSLMGWKAIGTELFQKIYTSGAFAHITIFAYPSFILMGAFWIKEKNKLDLALLILMITILLVSQIKYRIILPLLITFYFVMRSKLIKNLMFLKILGFIIGILLIFILSYFIGFSITFDFETACRGLDYLLRAFEDYIVAGPITLENFLNFPENYLSTEIVFTVPVNIYRFISGNSYFVNPILKKFFPISYNAAILNNTGTMFATLYLCLGYYGSLLFMMVLGFLVYVIYNITFQKTSVILNLLSSHLLAILTLSFFSYYFSILLIWEVAIAMILTPILLSLFSIIFRQNHKFSEK